MIERRDYDDCYAEQILTWCRDELTFYKWTAGTLGGYPLSKERFRKVEELFPNVIFDGSELVGFFTLRQIDQENGAMRIGYILIDPEKRGMGYGKALLREGLSHAKEAFGAKRVSAVRYWAKSGSTERWRFAWRRSSAKEIGRIAKAGDGKEAKMGTIGKRRGKCYAGNQVPELCAGVSGR